MSYQHQIWIDWQCKGIYFVHRECRWGMQMTCHTSQYLRGTIIYLINTIWKTTVIWFGYHMQSSTTSSFWVRLCKMPSTFCSKFLLDIFMLNILGCKSFGSTELLLIPSNETQRNIYWCIDTHLILEVIQHKIHVDKLHLYW